jgi:hypothetical protein
MNRDIWDNQQWGYFQVLLPPNTIRITAVESVFKWARLPVVQNSFYQIAPPFDFAEPFLIRSHKHIGEIYLSVAGKADIFLELDINDEGENLLQGDIPGARLWPYMPWITATRQELLDISVNEGLSLLEGWFHEGIAPNAPAHPAYTVKFYLWLETEDIPKTNCHDNCTGNGIHTPADEGTWLLQIPSSLPSPETER